MKLTVMLLVCAVTVGCTRTKPVSKCMADADQIISEVNEHRIVYGTSGQFATPLGQRRPFDLMDRDVEMISCIASDPVNRSHYREALDADDTVKTYRFLQYLIESQQMPEFARWERDKQIEAVFPAR
jgi:hypothetical protein